MASLHSNRLDSVIACVYRLSRSQSLELIRADRVFVNGKNIQTPTYICKPDDIISVRGLSCVFILFPSQEKPIKDV